MAEWTGTDYALLAAALAATHADVQSTKAFLRSGEGVETNPLLGANPSESRVENGTALISLGGILAANALPAKYRRALLGGWAGMEARLAYQNRKGSVTPNSSFAEVMKKPAMAGIAAALAAHYGLPLEVQPTPDGKGAGIGITRRF